MKLMTKDEIFLLSIKKVWDSPEEEPLTAVHYAFCQAYEKDFKKKCYNEVKKNNAREQADVRKDNHNAR